ncbi:deoxyguanosinetriphosphate triphosphohydrolase [Sphingomonas sp.]|uniref:deoxyguanosinetriphosphate triphosphohydrolase n=1 Tax=Sphingomonas sp. TaxID=28214 RepID=UPI002D7FC62C|nr:deoxyguanosinetriphosphate triphosphohydrolase [Sphingomonas sp.]HEU0044321.1 deoxyguanosinetriphosphate triphosphohydrolase [Sphingomonas sp.]
MTPAPYAADPARSRGRRHHEPTDALRGPRDAFQRDRDRVIHSISFRRLRHKTQVFMAPDGDHFRVRLTHSLEVAQIGRTVARALGLNEDLTEAICLAHDIGHPPFGHAGEDALKAALNEAGGFDHNGHTLRVLTAIERPYPGWDGLNLTWECLEGLAKHNGPQRHSGWAMREADAAFPLQLDSWPSLEAQVAAIADDIAYDNHDIDDGLRAGLLTLDQLMEVPMVARGWAAVQARFPDIAADASGLRLHRELVRAQIGVMVNDLLAETRARIAEARIDSVDAVRTTRHALVGFTAAMREEERTLKRFMYANLYHHPHQLTAAAAARTVVAGLFDAFHAEPALMGDRWSVVPSDEPGRSRQVADYIAGMTDRFAVSKYREIIGPVELPEGF